MSVEITTLAALSATDVQTNLATLTEMLQEANSTLDLRRGVLFDLLAYYHAALTTLDQANLNNYLSARSLQQISLNPSLADPATVADVLSNWRLSPGTGATATGEVVIELSSAISVTIGAGTVFTANGYTFTCDAAYTAKTDESLINSATDRLLTQLANGNWAFTVNVTASAIGTAYLVPKNTLVVPASLPLDYVTSYAASDFSGGVDPQTNAQLLNQLLAGFATKVPSNRITMAGLLQQQAAFAGVVSQSVIGCGDAEMLRDKHTILPLATGGRCDWYVRTQLQAQQTTLAKTATLLSVDNTGAGRWQVAILKDDAPGFFEVVSVLPTGSTASGTLPMTVTPGIDLSGDGFIPDIVNVIEGAFTRYQTAVLNFTDTTVNQSGLSPGATLTYAVTVSGLPLIDQIQDFAGSRDQRPYGSDVLIKAPVPCFVGIGFVIAKKRTQTDPDTVSIAAAVAAAVNGVDFTGQLYASQLQAVIQSFLPAGMNTGAIDMFGRIRCPDGSNRYVRASDILVIPPIPGLMVSSRTVQFFCNAASVSISVVTSVPVSS